MNNVLAAHVLLSHLPKITDGAYKTATEIAIETLCKDGINDWKKMGEEDTGVSAKEYLMLTDEQWNRYVPKLLD